MSRLNLPKEFQERNRATDQLTILSGGKDAANQASKNSRVETLRFS